MSGTLSATTPLLGLGLNQTINPSGAGAAAGTGPRYPTDGMQYGVTPGKVVRGNDANAYLLSTNGGTALTAGATVNVGPGPTFTIGGTGGTAGTVPVAVPAGYLCWVNLGII
jgi:hypothetical protein